MSLSIYLGLLRKKSQESLRMRKEQSPAFYLWLLLRHEEDDVPHLFLFFVLYLYVEVIIVNLLGGIL
jgi:hypothetical protein